MRNYYIKNAETLRFLLRIDYVVGGFSAIAGILFTGFFEKLLGLDYRLILWISIITMMYSIFSFLQAISKQISAKMILILVAGNYFWAIVSLALFFIHFENATPLGIIYLILQFIVVAGLAYFENKQVGLRSSRV